jgi:hypothetical protein
MSKAWVLNVKKHNKVQSKIECYIAKLDVTCCGQLKKKHEGLGILLEERMN